VPGKAPDGLRYTRPVPSQAIARSLAYINWTLLVALALGSLGALVVARQAGATRGYLLFTGVASITFGALALLADLALPDPTGLSIRPAPELDSIRRVALGAFIAVSVAYVLMMGRARAMALGVGAVGAGVVAAVAAGVGWAGGVLSGIPLAIQYLVLAAATGGVLATMILGHWYLVTPRLSERPLVVAARVLTAVVALQVVLFFVWTATGTGGSSQPFGALAGGSALFVWLRLLVGLLFPLAISFMAFRTASSRSMESATGLLYIDTAAIASGTIVAAGLYYGAGLLV
jgi:hypothetical protein